MWTDDLKYGLKEKRRDARRHFKHLKKTWRTEMTVMIAATLIILFILVRVLTRAAPQPEPPSAPPSKLEVKEIEVIEVEAPGPVADPEALRAMQLRAQVSKCLAARPPAAAEMCAAACAKAKNVGPRALAYQACMTGCERGAAGGWDGACKGGPTPIMDTKAVCRHVAARQDCRAGACARFRSSYPRPLVLNQCTSGCVEGANLACAQSKAYLTSINVE
ncbi:hypothetical protein JKP88DRAFT_284512 [Tribonema minus]|uniref:Uncharacterized protein n=1 Tax=Tribonema minus TaxID=303371 RepID=A0A835ZD79_9STRA|nr:hypothetical protein JKP88DRAFT_284512 [Tribonema minus]